MITLEKLAQGRKREKQDNKKLRELTAIERPFIFRYEESSGEKAPKKLIAEILRGVIQVSKKVIAGDKEATYNHNYNLINAESLIKQLPRRLSRHYFELLDYVSQDNLGGQSYKGIKSCSLMNYGEGKRWRV